MITKEFLDNISEKYRERVQLTSTMKTAQIFLLNPEIEKLISVCRAALGWKEYLDSMKGKSVWTYPEDTMAHCRYLTPETLDAILDGKGPDEKL